MPFPAPQSLFHHRKPKGWYRKALESRTSCVDWTAAKSPTRLRSSAYALSAWILLMSLLLRFEHVRAEADTTHTADVILRVPGLVRRGRWGF